MGGLVTLKCVFIDFDGTLVDSMDALYRIYIRFLKGFGHQGTKEEFSPLIGASLQEIVASLKENHQIDKDVTELCDIYHQSLQSCYGDEIALFPGVIEFLGYAKKRGLSLAIVTGAQKDLVEAVVESIGIDSYFEIIVSAEDVPHGKPDPAVYQSALQKLHLKPNQVLVIEDAENGVRSAESAGLTCLQFGSGSSSNWADVLEIFQKSI